MSIKSTAANMGTYALGLVIMLALLSLPVLLIVGGVVVGEKILPWLMLLSILVLGFDIIILVPLALIPPTRPWAGLGFFISSYVFGLTGWFMGLLLTWMLWGGIAVVIGLFIMGIGVVPIGMLVLQRYETLDQKGEPRINTDEHRGWADEAIRRLAQTSGTVCHASSPMRWDRVFPIRANPCSSVAT